MSQLHKLGQVIDAVGEIDDDSAELSSYTDFKYDEIKAIGEKTALFTRGEEEQWLPYSQLRHLDGDIYASEWILKQKGWL